MSALAKFVSTYGYEVSGSDAVRGETTEALAFYGIKIFVGADQEREELMQADVVVYTDAVPFDHEELAKARSMQSGCIRARNF